VRAFRVEGEEGGAERLVEHRDRPGHTRETGRDGDCGATVQ
jgi:hypothetical protein